MKRLVLVLLVLVACTDVRRIVQPPVQYTPIPAGNAAVMGKVQAKDGTTLPGVTVMLIKGTNVQTFVTDVQGNFRFIAIQPATYTLKAELAGYGTATRAGILVHDAARADVTLTLSPG